MATQLLSTITAILKEVYEDRIVSQLQTEAVGWKRIQSTSKGVTEKAGGKFVDFPIVVARNQGISYRAENEQLGNAGKAAYAEVQVGLKYGYARGAVSGQLIELAETNPQAFTSATDSEMDLMKDAAQKDQSRIFYGDSSGLLATITVGNGGGSTLCTVDDTYWLEVGMEVDVLVVSSGAALVTSREITAINSVTKVVTLSGANFTTLTTHGLYRAGNYASGTKREPEGLKSIVASSGTLYGVDPTSVDKWRATSTALGGSALSESAMIKMCDDIRRQGGKTSVILTTLGVRRAYFNLLTQQRRFSDTKEFAGGISGLPFNYGKEIPVVEDPDLTETTTTGEGVMYFLDENEFKFYHTGDWKFVDRDGSMFRWVSNYDQWEFMMRRYWQLGCSRRNGQGKLSGILEN